MAHFAKIENGIVTRVIVINNREILGSDGKEDETIGSQKCSAMLGGEWIQTSYNGKFRGCFAGIGYSWNPIQDKFIPPECTGVKHGIPLG